MAVHVYGAMYIYMITLCNANKLLYNQIMVIQSVVVYVATYVANQLDYRTSHFCWIRYMYLPSQPVLATCL